MKSLGGFDFKGLNRLNFQERAKKTGRLFLHFLGEKENKDIPQKLNEAGGPISLLASIRNLNFSFGNFCQKPRQKIFK